MATEQFGDIVIAPRVLEKIIAIATAKVEGVYSLENKIWSGGTICSSSDPKGCEICCL